MADEQEVAQAFTCTRCKKGFNAGEWHCKDGNRHAVPSKTYYVRGEGLSVHYGPVKGTDVQNHVRGVITFVRGMYQTADPEQQEFLDTYPGCISSDEWRETHLDAKEKEVLAKNATQRLQKENNELLAKIQALEAEKAALAAQGNSGAQGSGSQPPDGKKGK